MINTITRGYRHIEAGVSRVPDSPLNSVETHEEKCRHVACPQCHGTGVKESGQTCAHLISCPCPKCHPQFLSKPRTLYGGWG